jgi:hypothetical protein
VEREIDRAEPILREGLVVAQEAGDRLLTADFWSSIAFLEVVRGNPADAIPMRLRAIEIFREEWDMWKVADSVSGLALKTVSCGLPPRPE